MWILSAAYAAPPEVETVERIIAPEGLRTIRATPPRFPPLSPPVRCLLRVHIDAQGLPIDVEARDCPTSAGAIMAEAVRGWQWEPIKGETHRPAEALTIVPITFTPRGSVPVEPAARCTYQLSIASTGAVRVEGDAAPQCELWAPTYVASKVPSVGACELTIDATLVRMTEGWLDYGACDPTVWPFIDTLVSQSLFVTGKESTRLVVVLPDPSLAPQSLAPVLRVDEALDAGGRGRLDDAGNASVLDPKLDPKLEPTTSEVPAVDLSSLFGKPPPKPVPTPAPEEKPEEQ